MSSLREQAEYLRVALLVGLVKVVAVVRWADAVIDAIPEPPIEIIDLALAGTSYPKDVAGMLARQPGDANLAQAAHRVLGEIKRRLVGGFISTDEVANMLFLYSRFARVAEDEEYAAGMFSDSMHLAKVGYLNVVDVERQIESHLSPHAEEPESFEL